MRIVKNLPIKKKVIAISVGTTITALLLASAIFVSTEIDAQKKVLLESTTTLAKVIGVSTSAALGLRDTNAASEILDALKAEHIAIAGILYDITGHEFARYLRAESGSGTSIDQNAIVQVANEHINFNEPFFTETFLFVRQTIESENEIIGYMDLYTDLAPLLETKQRLFTITIVVLFVAFIISYWFSSWLQNLVTDPINKLATSMENLAINNDYSIRVERTTFDELGILTEGFNRMLDQIQKRDQDLAQTVNELRSANDAFILANRQLDETQSQLLESAKLASLGEISAGIAHEINQPLGAISLYIEHLDSLAKETTPEVTPIIEKTLSQIDRITKIIQHLRIFSRDDALVEKENTEIGWLIDESLVLLGKQLAQQSVSLELNIEDPHVTINCNSVQIFQVITNLVTNARDAVKDKEKKIIRISTHTENDYLIIVVQDNGAGIPSDIQKRIFDPFFTTKPVGEGTGLGMSICYGIVTDHEGTIFCESEVGVGSRMIVKLPTAQQQIS